MGKKIPNFQSILRCLAFIAFLITYLITLTIETLLRPYYKKIFAILLNRLKF